MSKTVTLTNKCFLCVELTREFPVPRRRSFEDGAVSTNKEITPDNSRCL